MPTVINNPVPVRDSSNGMGFLLGIIVLIVLAVLVFQYGIPYLSTMNRGTQVTVPGKIDVNVHTNGK